MGTLLLAFAWLIAWPASGDAKRLLVAPMLEGLALCENAANDSAIRTEAAGQGRCDEKNESPGRLIERKLASIGPALSKSGRYELGYTLTIPLLHHYHKRNDRWHLDENDISRMVRTIRDVDRPAVVYFYSNHFGAAGDQPSLDKELARDPNNLAITQHGPLEPDRYFHAPVYPWRLADFESDLTRYRERAMRQALKEICKLPKKHVAKIRAATILGEVHHHFPDFFGGMGYGTGPYRIGDYSAASIRKFREFLRERYARIESLNEAVGAEFQSFEEVSPPAKDIRKQKLRHFTEHLDSFAHGELPIFGWVHDRRGREVHVRVHIDGRLVQRTPAWLNRLDVLEARPEVGTANVGWRYELDFSKLAPGVHRIDVFAERAGMPLVRLATLPISIMDRRQSGPAEVPLAEPLPAAVALAPDGELAAWTDHPAPQASFFYNELAKLWLEYRQTEVNAEIGHYAAILGASCLGRERIFSHQINPRSAATWDWTKYASDASLAPNARYQIGVNLYGGAAYGDFIFDWLKRSGIERYGVPELHPMHELPPEGYRQLFDAHARHGAVFLVPYFVSLVPQRMRPDREHNKFMIEPGNLAYGSGAFHAAIQRLMGE